MNLKTKIVFITLLLSLKSFPQQSVKKIEKYKVLKDLEYLRESLEKAHYNLYTYVTKKSFDKNYETIKSSITKDSLTLLEVTSLFQSVISKVNNGHTEIPFPVNSYLTYAENGGTLFPLDLAFENGKAFIRKNLSDNTDLKVGSEIISINNRTINETLVKIFPLISAERRYFKLAKLELFSFPRYHWQAWGRKKEFKVTIRSNGKVKNYQLTPITVKDFHSKRNEIFSSNRELKFMKNSAYLKPGNFSGDEKKYHNFIDSSFIKINKANSSSLIIDLRNNLGGNDSYSDYMVSYIASRPFRWNSEFTLKTSTILKDHAKKNYDITEPYWKKIMENEDGSVYPYEFDEYQPQPKNKRFLGKVYVLVNRQSHSQSAVTASQIQDYGFGIIVGEETGDYPSLLASQYTYNLNHTGIEVKISKGFIVRVNGSKKAEGVIPNIYIKDHLIDENDEILDGLLRQINNEH